MTVNNIIRIIKEIARQVKTVRSAYDGDVYTIWNTGEIKYGSFVVGLTSAEKRDNLRVYHLVMYYADRLMQNGKNKNSIWDDAFNTLQTVINELIKNGNFDCEDYTFNCFEQKFLDDLAGAWVELTLYAEDDLGECNMNKIMIDDADLIEKLKALIEKYKQENEELALILKEILYKISGEEIE